MVVGVEEGIVTFVAWAEAIIGIAIIVTIIQLITTAFGGDNGGGGGAPWSLGGGNQRRRDEEHREETDARRAADETAREARDASESERDVDEMIKLDEDIEGLLRQILEILERLPREHTITNEKYITALVKLCKEVLVKIDKEISTEKHAEELRDHMRRTLEDKEKVIAQIVKLEHDVDIDSATAKKILDELDWEEHQEGIEEGILNTVKEHLDGVAHHKAQLKMEIEHLLAAIRTESVVELTARVRHAIDIMTTIIRLLRDTKYLEEKIIHVLRRELITIKDIYRRIHIESEDIDVLINRLKTDAHNIHARLADINSALGTHRHHGHIDFELKFEDTKYRKLGKLLADGVDSSNKGEVKQLATEMLQMAKRMEADILRNPSVPEHVKEKVKEDVPIVIKLLEDIIKIVDRVT